jgi:uncharacterized membrane protein
MGEAMRVASLVGMLLIILGIVSLAFQGIHYTTHKELAQVDRLHVNTEEHKTISLPPVLGGLALAGGVVLLLVSKKEL